MSPTGNPVPLTGSMSIIYVLSARVFLRFHWEKQTKTTTVWLARRVFQNSIHLSSHRIASLSQDRFARPHTHRHRHTTDCLFNSHHINSLIWPPTIHPPTHRPSLTTTTMMMTTTTTVMMMHSHSGRTMVVGNERKKKCIASGWGEDDGFYTIRAHIWEAPWSSRLPSPVMCMPKCICTHTSTANHTAWKHGRGYCMHASGGACSLRL